jgi:hypothetical protein
MIEKISTWFIEHTPFLYAMLLSLWAGLVQYASKVRGGERWDWREVALDLIVCSFAGLLAFFLCNELEIVGWKAALVISLSAHEGTRAIGLIAHFRDKFLGVRK